jgi:hypothetical protein
MAEQAINIGTNVDQPAADPNVYLPAFTTSRFGDMDIYTASAMPVVARELGKVFVWCASSYTTVAAGRVLSLEMFKNFFPDYYKKNPHVIRGFWIDSDIRILNPLEVVEAVKWADENRKNIVGNYFHAGFGGNRLHLGTTVYSGYDSGTEITIEDISSGDKYQKVKAAGLGFYYGDINLDYQFHESRQGGDDFNWYKDQNLEVYLARDINLKHRQTIYI